MPPGDGNRGKGKCAAWIFDHLEYQGDDCLIWPFNRTTHGYGQLGYMGGLYMAHRLMCVMAHGPAPAGKPQAAHSCGNGHRGCCNPRHLSWKSNSENQRDRRAHGTQKGGIGPKTRLTQEQIERIWQSPGKETQFGLAADLGVKRGTVEYWLRRAPQREPAGT